MTDPTPESGREMKVTKKVKLNLDVPGRIRFESLVCRDCGWSAPAPQKSGAIWQATKHAERKGCREFELEMVETRAVRAVRADTEGEGQ